MSDYNYIVRSGPYSVFGTAASPKTLTAAYVADTNAIQVFDGFSKCTIEVSFTPGGNGEFCDVLVETSEDVTNGIPTVFFPFSEYGFPSAVPVAAYIGVEGVPYESPRDVATPQAATNYKRSYTVDVTAKYLRFTVKSTAGANFGTAWVRVMFSE